MPVFGGVLLPQSTESIDETLPAAKKRKIETSAGYPGIQNSKSTNSNRECVSETSEKVPEIVVVSDSSDDELEMEERQYSEDEDEDEEEEEIWDCWICQESFKENDYNNKCITHDGNSVDLNGNERALPLTVGQDA